MGDCSLRGAGVMSLTRSTGEVELFGWKQILMKGFLFIHPSEFHTCVAFFFDVSLGHGIVLRYALSPQQTKVSFGSRYIVIVERPPPRGTKAHLYRSIRPVFDSIIGYRCRNGFVSCFQSGNDNYRHRLIEGISALSHRNVSGFFIHHELQVIQ